MAVMRLLFRGKLGERLPDTRKKEQRIVAESALAARIFKNGPLRRSAKRLQRPAVLGRGEHAHKPPGALLRRNAAQLPEDARIIRLIVSIGLRQMWLLSRVPGRMNSGRSSERIHLEPGVVGYDHLSRRG